MRLFLLLANVLQTPPNEPAQFFTLETLFSAAGATTAVITVTTVLHGLIPKLSARWFALGFSFFLTVVGIGVQHQPYSPANLLLAVINALVIYAAAVGVNNMATSSRAGGAAPPGPPAVSKRWWP